MKRNLLVLSGGILIVTLAVILVILFGNANRAAKKNVPLSLLKEAEGHLLSGNFLEARRLYKKAMENVRDSNQLKDMQKKLEELNIKILFSPLLDECSAQYTVKPADTLANIAKAYTTTVELIMRANSLKSDIIKPGQKLKVITCKFSMAVDKSQNILFLKVGDELIKTYGVATGKDTSTPSGTFKIISKEVNPTWFKTGAVIPPNSPENILGTRWMGFDIKGYGIHGTTDDKSIGQHVTSGCVRMRNQDVEELFDITPLGTEVTIVD